MRETIKVSETVKVRVRHAMPYCLQGMAENNCVTFIVLVPGSVRSELRMKTVLCTPDMLWFIY